MGLLDQLAGQVLGNLSNSQGSHPLAQVAGELLQQHGGLPGLLEKFRSAGLAEQAASWVSTGRNLPIDANQIAQALGSSDLSQLAARFGLNPQQLSSGLADALPQFIDRVTPNGRVEGSDALVSQGLSMLGDLLGKR